MAIPSDPARPKKSIQARSYMPLGGSTPSCLQFVNEEQGNAGLTLKIAHTQIVSTAGTIHAHAISTVGRYRDLASGG